MGLSRAHSPRSRRRARPGDQLELIGKEPFEKTESCGNRRRSADTCRPLKNGKRAAPALAVRARPITSHQRREPRHERLVDFRGRDGAWLGPELPSCPESQTAERRDAGATQLA